MVWQLRGQIVNGIGFARAWWSIKQKSLPRLELERFELVPRFHESGHIAVEQFQIFVRQNNIFPVNLSQPMHLDNTASAHRMDLCLERDDAAQIHPMGGGSIVKVHRL